MFRNRSWIGATGLVIALGGCATNALRVEYAGKVAEQGHVAAVASRQFLGKVEASRRAANIALVTADAACGRPDARLRTEPELVRTTNGGALCSGPGGPAGNPLSLKPLTDQLTPALTLIEALSSYADALTQIVEAKPADPARQFEDAFTTAKAAEGLFVAVLNKHPVLPAEDDKRVAAVKDFIGYLGELAAQQDKVDQLRKLVAKRPEGEDPIFSALRSQIAIWENSRKGDEVLLLGLAAQRMQHALNAAPPVASKERHDAMVDFYARSDAAETAGQLYPALDHLLVVVAETDKDLRRVLKADPHLSRTERARVAEIARQRVVRALSAVTAIVNAFRGT
ncbi:hypothetical protein KX816_18955 [Sphingosinicellaceae bacterium]|nr:hypothetical protein KX816_18955 [Sphingosinicellaceae bacterium]